MSPKTVSKWFEYIKRHYKDFLERFQPCIDNPQSDECVKLLQIANNVERALLEVFFVSRQVDMLRDIMRFVYRLCYLYEWLPTPEIRSMIDSILSTLKGLGVVDENVIKHARAIARGRKLKAVSKNIPTFVIKGVLTEKLIQKIQEVAETEVTEDGKVVYKIDKDRLTEISYGVKELLMELLVKYSILEELGELESTSWFDKQINKFIREASRYRRPESKPDSEGNTNQG